MSEEPERIVVIQLASRDANTMAIKWALQGLSLGTRDEITLLAILRHVRSSPMFTFIAPGKLHQKIVEKEVAKRKEEYHNNAEIMKITEQCETDKIQFRIEVLAGPFPEVAVNAATSLRATLVILDRKMKKYKKHFMERLSCGILLMKRDNSIEHLRGQMEIEHSGKGKAFCVKCSGSSLAIQFTGNSFSCPWNSTTSRSSSTTAKNAQLQSQGRQNSANRELDMARGFCLLSSPDTQETCHTEMLVEQENHSHNLGANQIVEQFKNSICSLCDNRRPNFGSKRDFTYAELQAATQGFSQKNFLSEGGFGAVYRGKLHGLKIAVKQHRCASLQGEKEFKSEVNLLSKARHENVVMLLGSCSEGNERLLVYEYVCNGSLDQHLSPHSRKPLSWPDRIKVALGAGKGLLYLHENNIIHRDMRPNNILVTHDYETLLGDFGLARPYYGDSVYSTDIAGTIGYLAPEYAESGKASTKTDVYSFGVVLLQLITGMRITDKRLRDKSLVGWARPLLKERNYPDLIDERMMDSHDCHQLFWMIRLAEKCLSRDPRKRLVMDTVVNALTHIAEGSTCSVVLRDCSPSRSDSSYEDMPDSPKLEGSMQGSSGSPGDGEDGSFYEGSTPTSSNMRHTSLRLSPSPPLGSTYSSVSSLSM